MLDQIRQRLPNDHLVVRVVFPAPGMSADRRRPTRPTMLGRLRVPIRHAAPAAGRRDTTMRLIRTYIRIMHRGTLPDAERWSGLSGFHEHGAAMVG